MAKDELKKRIQSLRRKGYSYSEMQKIVGVGVPKSTLSCWCNAISLTTGQLRLLKKRSDKKLIAARKIALETNRKKRETYLGELRSSNNHLIGLLQSADVAKLMAVMLFLGEGAKNRRGSLMFGNSDPAIIKLFLQLLRKCYKIDESKFRCTVQCRADQNVEYLERFWSKVTQIPLNKFYKARIDPRTIGKPSKKKDYKGVCRIELFWAHVFNEIKIIADLVTK